MAQVGVGAGSGKGWVAAQVGDQVGDWAGDRDALLLYPLNHSVAPDLCC